VHQLPSLPPNIVVRQEDGTQVIAQELCSHGKLLAARVKGATLAEEVIGDLLERYYDIGTASNVDLVDWSVLAGPLLEFEPGMEEGKLEKVAK
jgi:hypothetical protein